MHVTVAVSSHRRCSVHLLEPLLCSQKRKSKRNRGTNKKGEKRATRRGKDVEEWPEEDHEEEEEEEEQEEEEAPRAIAARAKVQKKTAKKQEKKTVQKGEKKVVQKEERKGVQKEDKKTAKKEEKTTAKKEEKTVLQIPEEKTGNGRTIRSVLSCQAEIGSGIDERRVAVLLCQARAKDLFTPKLCTKIG